MLETESILFVPRFSEESIFVFLAFLEEKQDLKIAT